MRRMRDSAQMLTWREVSIVLAGSVAFSVWYAVKAGQDMNWDLRNYHYYGVNAWLSGRHLSDVYASQIQTWLNPFGYLLQYLLIEYLRPVVAGAILGAIAGLNGFLVYVLCRSLIKSDREWHKWGIAGLVAVAALTGPIFISQMGTTFNDYILSILVLGGIVLLANQGSPASTIRYLVAGALVGVAAGLKPTSAVYVVATGIAIAAVVPSIAVAIKRLSMFTVGAAAGYIATAGYWMTILWMQFDNPVFPFMNSIFRSSWVEPINLRDDRFLPESFADAITYPFQWLIGLHPSNELPLRDARFALLAVLVPLVLLTAGTRILTRWEDSNRAVAPLVRRRFGWFVIIFFLSAYIMWLAGWGIHRYATVLELLAPIVLVIALDLILNSRVKKIGAIIVLTVFVISWSKPPDWGRVSYSATWFEFTGQIGSDDSEHALFVMLGNEPISYFVPMLGKNAQIVRIDGNLQIRPNRGLGKQISEIVRLYTGPIRSISWGSLNEEHERKLAEFGLMVMNPQDCQTIRSRVDEVAVCQLVKNETNGGVNLPP